MDNKGQKNPQEENASKGQEQRHSGSETGRISRFLQNHDRLYLYLRTIRCALSEGPEEAKRRYAEYVNARYGEKYQGHLMTRREVSEQKRHHFDTEVTFSIIVPLYNTNRKYLRAMIRSVRKQTYPGWELCMADGSDERHRSVGLYCRIARLFDSRIKYQRLEDNLGISENSNACLRMSSGNYIVLLDHDDLLHRAALYEVMRAIDEKKADFIYTDEGIFQKDPEDTYSLHRKPDFSPDYLRSLNYICHLTAFSRELLNRLEEPFRAEYDGSQDYDLILRLTEKANQIAHVPKILYFWRNHPGSVASGIAAKPYTVSAGKRAVQAQLERMTLVGEVLDAFGPSTYRIKYKISGEPKISIVIPNMDHREDLEKCIRSIQEKSTWKNWEIIIVENNSREDETFRYYQEVTGTDKKIRVVRWEKGFNFSAICNYGVSFATGEYILLLNNDVEVITPEWMEEMLMFAQRADVGTVGCLLYYPDDIVQHAGVILGIGAAAGHAHRWFRNDDPGNLFRLSVAVNYSAVTGACMMIPRKVYREVSGLDESFVVALNDVDLCMRIREKGYLIVFTPFAKLYHYESKSRGSDESGANKERFESEAAHFRERWRRELENGDPYYNPNLTLIREDFTEKRTEEG